MSTAAGPCSAERVLPVYSETLDKFLRPYVLDDCPPVISVGQRVENDGFSFQWHHGSPPVLISPEGKRIELTVQNHVPYLLEETRIDAAYAAHLEPVLATSQHAAETRAGSGPVPPHGSPLRAEGS